MIGNSINLSKLGITELSAMQKEVCHTIINSKQDVVILSPTGSGKTVSYLFPLLQLLNENTNETQAVVIVPNRELAIQSQDVLRRITAFIRGYACYGGHSTMDEHRALRQILPHIIFATPGKLNDHLHKENFSTKTIKYVVIDEFDKCLEMGFQKEMKEILLQLPNIKQRILLSATDTDEIPHFVNINKAQRINYLAQEQAQTQIYTYYINSTQKDKLETLTTLLLSLGNQSSIVFANYRESAERIKHFLLSKGFYAALFHGGLDQKQREDALYKFANGSANILVSTDLASRGLDIPDVDNIIHYHLPEHQENYVHRIGRTARWKKKGNTFLIIGPSETIPEYINTEIKEFTPSATPTLPIIPKMITIYIGKGKKDKLGKMDIVGFLCKKCNLQANEIGRIDINDYYAYVAIARNKYQQVLKLSKGEKIKGLKTIFELAE